MLMKFIENQNTIDKEIEWQKLRRKYPYVVFVRFNQSSNLNEFLDPLYVLLTKDEENIINEE